MLSINNTYKFSPHLIFILYKLKLVKYLVLYAATDNAKQWLNFIKILITIILNKTLLLKPLLLLYIYVTVMLECKPTTPSWHISFLFKNAEACFLHSLKNVFKQPNQIIVSIRVLRNSVSGGCLSLSIMSLFNRPKDSF